jgi:hypothetical protein
LRRVRGLKKKKSRLCPTETKVGVATFISKSETTKTKKQRKKKKKEEEERRRRRREMGRGDSKTFDTQVFQEKDRLLRSCDRVSPGTGGRAQDPDLKNPPVDPAP